MDDRQILTFATTDELLDELLSRYDAAGFCGVKFLKSVEGGRINERRMVHSGDTLTIMGLLRRLEGEVFAADVKRDMSSGAEDDIEIDSDE